MGEVPLCWGDQQRLTLVSNMSEAEAQELSIIRHFGGWIKPTVEGGLHPGQFEGCEVRPTGASQLYRVNP